MPNHMNDGMYSSNSSDWATPRALFDKLNEEFQFDIDICADENNHKCEKYFSIEDNALTKDWSKFKTIYMNPPYGREIIDWVKKAYESSLQGSTVVCLLPSRTDTTWWHSYCMKGEIRFIKGRLHFNDSKNAAPFPSAIVVFKGKNNEETNSWAVYRKN